MQLCHHCSHVNTPSVLAYKGTTVVHLCHHFPSLVTPTYLVFKETPFVSGSLTLIDGGLSQYIYQIYYYVAIMRFLNRIL